MSSSITEEQTWRFSSRVVITYRPGRLTINCSKSDVSHELRDTLADAFVQFVCPLKLSGLFHDVKKEMLSSVAVNFIKLRRTGLILETSAYSENEFRTPYWEDAWLYNVLAKTRFETKFVGLQQQNRRHLDRIRAKQPELTSHTMHEVISAKSLAPPLPDLTLPEILQSRRTRRTFGNAPLSLDEISWVLDMSFGVRREWQYQDSIVTNRFRSSPSGGGLLSVNAIVIALDVSGLHRDVYRYCPIQKSLTASNTKVSADWITEAFAGQTWISNASIIVLLTANFCKLKERYNASRIYRMANVEAGHIAQTFLLCSEFLGWSAFSVGGMNDEKMEAGLKLDRQCEVPLYAVGGGSRSTISEAQEWENQAFENNLPLVDS